MSTMGAVPQTKGIGFVNVRTFVRDRFGSDAWGELMQRFDTADREMLESVVPVGWYPLALYSTLINEVERVHGRGDRVLMEQLGMYEAEHDLKTVHRIFLRMANPAFIIEQVANYWARFHDTGEWQVVRHDPHHATGNLRNWGVVDAALCQEAQGYIKRALELVGAKCVSVQHSRCRVSGSSECEFDARWG